MTASPSPLLAAALRASTPAEARERASAILDAGFERLVLEAPLYWPAWEALRAHLGRDTVSALRLFVPYPRRLRPGFPAAFDITSLDREERLRALKQAEATLAAADMLRAPYVLVPVVGLSAEDPPRPQAPRNPAAGGTKPQPGIGLRGAVLDAALQSLLRLLERADRYEIQLCLTPTSRSQEFPSPAETEYCLEEFRGAPLGVWFDTIRLPEVFSAPEGQPTKEVSALPGPAGVHVRDLTREGRIGTPRSGSVPWNELRTRLMQAAVWALDLERPIDTVQLENARAFLEEYRSPVPPESGLMVP